MNARIAGLFHPSVALSKADTSLRYTDILFGFVIKELFTRLQNWPRLDISVRLHLVVATTLVLGSWIGYRRSVNRTAYEVKFFNLPFFRFIVDQLMLVFYFRIAVLTNIEPSTAPPVDLSSHTLALVLWIFALYLIWDGLCIWMSFTTIDSPRQLRYPDQHADWTGTAITVCTLLVLALLKSRFGSSLIMLPALIAILILYRWAKEVRTTWKTPAVA